MESFLIVIYGIAFVFIIYYAIQLQYAKPLGNAMISVSADTNGTDVWPWPITKPNFWTEWFDTKSVYTHPGYRHAPAHQSGYGYTGRQCPTETNTIEGDHYDWDLDGGAFYKGGYGYTGR